MQSKIVPAREPGGWMEARLSETEMEYLWKRIETAEKKDQDVRNELIGQISSSLELDDPDNSFNNNVLVPLADQFCKYWPTYQERFMSHYPRDKFRYNNFEIKLDSWWVNKQKQYEYNPIHDHSGIFSFTIWMHEAVDFEEQNQKDNAVKTSRPQNNSFAFHYQDILGNWVSTGYQLNKRTEAIMLFFPAGLHHSVNPFFDSDDTRVSIAGNMAVFATPKEDVN